MLRGIGRLNAEHGSATQLAQLEELLVGSNSAWIPNRTQAPQESANLSHLSFVCSLVFCKPGFDLDSTQRVARGPMRMGLGDTPFPGRR